MSDDSGSDFDIDEERSSSDSQQSSSPQPSTSQHCAPAQKRAHHNALERRRRDEIKESFNQLRDSVPVIRGKNMSRAKILRNAKDYLIKAKENISAYNEAIKQLKRQNEELEKQFARDEAARNS